MIDTDIAARIVSTMNEALELAPSAIGGLVAQRFEAEGLRDHPSIQIAGDGSVGILGLLNGIAGANSSSLGAVAAIVDGDGTILRFELLLDRADD